MNKFQTCINKFTDIDWLWWPLLALRPEKSKKFTLGLSMGLSVISVLVGQGIAVIFYLSIGGKVSIAFSIALTIVLFSASQIVFLFVKDSWNKRAVELSNEEI